ncbi:sulfotransferase family protein [Ideonella sp. BN130291]|uniref:sulfotransferase family protein n=1 Tax=Ideonella sp. BN130291 TaxID=3112940 RepID=UPI002E2548B7|nr:sulfotransferase [Ideonella sp. BN130291]
MELSEAALLAAARRDTGLDRFGDERFLPALRALLRALAEEADLNEFGTRIAWGRTLGSLKNRLWSQACFEAHPQIVQRPLAAPLIIVGPHRSGTTRLHRMLACDARLQHLRTWEGMNPAPRVLLDGSEPPAARAQRREEACQALEMRHRMYPESFVMHPMHPDWPEEEMLLLNHSFCSFSALGLYDIPGYYRWFLQADKHGAYGYMADQMRLVEWSRNTAPGRRWIMKNPQHMMDLDLLLATFPDAKLVFTHRDPVKTVGSVMSLMWHFAARHTDRPCRDGIRDTWLDFCEQAARRCMQSREKIAPAQQLDVHYDEMNKDWRSVMRRIYRFAGMDFTPDAEAAMAAWLVDSEQEARHVGHRYAIEDFGITRGEVNERMKFVRDAYGIAPETAPA